MIRLIAVALALASSTQAMPIAPPHHPDDMLTMVRELLRRRSPSSWWCLHC
jgi:hypothetical protein